jgi:hypothetical protein
LVAPGNSVVYSRGGKGVLPKLFLGILAIAWIVVLVPPVLRARADSRSRGDSIGDFQNRLGVLSRTHSARHARRAARAARGEIVPMPGVASALGVRQGAGRVANGRGAPNQLMPNHVTPPNRLAHGRAGTRSVRSPMGAPLAGPLAPVRNPGAERSARRRREVVTVLFAATTLSAAVASAMGGGVVWALQILTDLVLLVYVVGMMWFRSGTAGRSRTVGYLPQVRPRPAPAYALRRTASS